MTAALWLVPLLAALPGASVCVGTCVATDDALAPVLGTSETMDGTVDGLLGAVDGAFDTVDGTLDEVTTPRADDAGTPTEARRASSVKDQVQDVVAATPWWAALGGSLLAILAVGFHGPLAAMFSRIRRDRVLDHPTRHVAYDLVEAAPGLAVDELAQRAGVAWQTMRGHLRRLEAHGLVVAQRSGKRRLYFVAGTPAAQARSHHATLRPTARRRIAALLLQEPDIDQAGVCQRVGLRNPTASKHLARLQEAGLVEARPDGRRRRYRATAALARVLRGPEGVAA